MQKTYISYKEKNITEETRKKLNEEYIKEKLKEEKKYFDKMFKGIDDNVKLDENQRKIILTDEKYTMVIAGAGSGKTTTITAKVKYLIEKQKIKAEEIIIISFTNKAVEELKKRINQDFKKKVEITTFHKLGYKIIKENNQHPTIIKDNKIIEQYIKKQKEEKRKKHPVIYKIIEYIRKKLKIKEKTSETEIIKLYKQYINLYKSKLEIEEKPKIKKQTTKKEKNKNNEFKKMYQYYQQELQTKKQIDFEDIINMANRIIQTQNQIKKRYKYIIIDEYQDISENRYNLIKNLANKNNAKIMVVGDDWQCIYSFASSNINLFTNFKKSVEYCETLKIEKTYRNSQQLIDIAGEFIQKNPNQIKKTLKSDKKLENPLKIKTYTKQTINQELKKTLDYLIKKYGENKNILILGRYTFDKNEIIDNEIEIKNTTVEYKKYQKVKIDYLTVHTSKGLGYDNVILINAKNTKLGFPSKIKTNPIIKTLITQEETINYSEERRLFYVALTRTKNEIIIISPKNNMSEFVKEIKKYVIKIKNKNKYK